MKKSVIIGAAAVVVLGGLAAFIIPRLVRDKKLDEVLDLQHQIAVITKVKPEFIHVNLPPASGRYPGSVFVVAESWLPMSQVAATSADLTIGPPYTVKWQTRIEASGGGELGLGPAGEAMKGDAVGEVDMEIGEARTIEMLTPALKKHLLAVSADAAKYDSMIVVTRSYEGVPRLRIHRRSGASAEAWKETKEQAQSAEAQPGIAKVSLGGKDDDLITLEMSERVVVAFELAKAHFVANSLAPTPDDVKLVPLTPEEVAVGKKKAP